MSQWSFSTSPTFVALLGLLWLLTAWLCWANWARRKGRGIFLMECLRMLTVSCILFTLIQPEWVQRVVETETPEVVILHDASGSMSTRDVAFDSEVVARSAWLDRQLAQALWGPLSNRAEISVESFCGPPDAAAMGPDTNGPPLKIGGTDLDSALQEVLDRRQHLQTVLLLTDGDWNQGNSPLTAAIRYRSRKIPIFTVAIGSETPLPDLFLDPLVVPSYGLLGEQISIPFKVRSTLSREVRTQVTLSGPRGPESSKEIVIPPFGQIQDAIVWMPRSEGDYLWRISIPLEIEEYLRDNNEQTFRITVRTEKLKVLLVDSLPRWEYRYLRNALERDPGVEVSCLLFHPGLAAGQGTNYLSSFPSNREELAAYDVVFLGDVGIGENELTMESAIMIKGLVEQQASGLVFLPGRRGRQSTFANSSLDDLMPVTLDAGHPEGISSGVESSLLLSLSGQGHFLTMLANDEQRNAAIWKGLPGFYWNAAVTRARPGAEVLAVHGDLRAEGARMPLLVTRPFGSGEVLFLGTDHAWRWRRGVEDKYHYRFWGQVVRWMAHKRHMAHGDGFRLSYSPENPVAGQKVYLQATAVDRVGLNPAEQVSAQITSASGRTEQVALQTVAGGWGVYLGQFMPLEGGEFQIRLQSTDETRRLETRLLVAEGELEKSGQVANFAVLRQIAEVTSGRFGTIDDLSEMLRSIALLPEREPQELRFRLWSNPWWGGMILTLLAIYWTARKAAGMV